MTTLEPYKPPAPRTWVELLPAAAKLAGEIAGTDFVPAAMRNNPAMVAAAILYGDEVGIGPMQSLAHIAVINGRPTLASETQRAMILAAGHDIRVEETTVTRCVVAGRRRDSDAISRVTWTMDDAKRAGLAGKPPWRAYPRQMLLARASAELARAVFPDAIGGMAATEELQDNPEPTNGPAAIAEEPKTKRRRRANVTTPDRPTPEPEQGEEPVSGPGAAGNAPGPTSPPVEEPPATEAARRKLFALYRERGFTERGDRLAYANMTLGRQVETSTDLTAGEVSTLIDALEVLPAVSDPPAALPPEEQAVVDAIENPPYNEFPEGY